MRQLISVGRVGAVDFIQLCDNFAQPSLLFFLDGTTTGFCDRSQLWCVFVRQIQVLLTTSFQRVVSQRDLRQIDAFTFPPELQQPNQALEEDRSFLEIRVAVIEYLLQERVCPQIRRQIAPEENQSVHRVFR